MPARELGPQEMTEPSSVHVPVLLEQVVQWLDPQPGMVLVDGTLGGGGHTRLLADARGPRADWSSASTAIRPPSTPPRRPFAGLPVRLVQANFCDLPEVLEQLEIREVDGVVLDLGLSSDQLADRSRGFSFSADGPLDLRFDPHVGRAGPPADQPAERGALDRN